MSEYPTLTLLPHQADHYRKVLEILNQFYFYVDGSKQGTGKTFVAAGAAIQLQLPVVVVCPLSVKHVWQQVFETYGIPTYQIPQTGGVFTYDTLRARKTQQPKHGLLTRIDAPEGVRFIATDLWKAIVQAGVFIVFDEISKLKNNSAQNKAARGLIQELYAQGGRSRAALLSGTPIDKREQVINFVRMVGFMNERNLYNQRGGQMQLEGINELLRWAQQINPTLTTQFLQSHQLEANRQSAVNYTYELFISAIRPGIMSIMPNPLDQMKDIKNGFYYLSPEDDLLYRQGIRKLIMALKFRPERLEEPGQRETLTPEQQAEQMMRMAEPSRIVRGVIEETTNFGAVTEALIQIQLAKTNALIRVAKRFLDQTFVNERGQTVSPKVVLYASYYDVIDRLLMGLADYNPVELTGRVSERKRVQNIQAFQQPNNQVRVFIGNPLAGGLGISLQDITGLYPRYMFILPDYRINEILQASDRTTRPGIVASTYVRFFYGLSGTLETAIIEALSRKGEVMREVTIEQTYSGALFPDQFENEIEDLPPGAQVEFDPTFIEREIERLSIQD